MNVHVGLAGGGFQILAGAATDVENVALGIDQHGGRRETLLDQLVGELPEVLATIRGVHCSGGGGRDRRSAGKVQRHQRLRLVEAPKDACLVVEWREQIAEIANGFGAAEHEQPTLAQGVIEQRQQLFLQLGTEIDQQVAAGEDIEFGEGRVGDDVLRGEHHHFADVLADAIAAAFFGHEEALQPFGRDIRRDIVGVEPLARRVDGIRIKIGGVDLQGKTCQGRFWLRLFQGFLEHHGQRVSLFAGGAGRHPGAQGLAGWMLRQQRRQGFGPQGLPHRGIAEKIGDADQQFLEQQIKLMEVAAQMTHVIVDGGDLVHRHAPLDAAVERVGLVEREIVAAAVAQQDDDLVERTQHFCRGGWIGQRRMHRMPQVVGDSPRHGFGGGDDIGDASLHGTTRHAVGLGAGGFLHQRQPGFFLDRAQAENTV